LADVASVLEAARSEGRLVQKLRLDQIEADHLIRDRLAVDLDEMAALKDSLTRRGQQNPIEVVALDGDRYGLISGWRRLNALRALTQEGGVDTVLARVIAPGSQAEAYVAMVEENEIRVGLTYYERARIVVRAVKAGIYPNRKKALQGLFANVSRAKRSKIGSFVDVVEALDDRLQFPTQIGERLGLQMAKVLKEDRGRAVLLSAVEGAQLSAEAEQKSIAQALSKLATAEVRDTSSAPHTPDVVGLKGLRITNSGVRSKGPMVIEGDALTPKMRQAILTWLRAEVEPDR